MGIKGFFHGLFDRENEKIKEEATDRQRDESLEKSAEHESSQTKENLKESGALPDLSGALLAVYRVWDEFAPPCELSLTEGLTAECFLLDPKELQRESTRIGILLEQDAKKRLKAIEARKQEEEPQPMDAEPHVYLSKDKMLAWLFIFPPVGEGGKLTLESISNALRDQNVVSGLDSGAMVRAFEEKRLFTLLPVAVGTPPVQGKNGTVIEHFAREMPFEVKIDEHGFADYRQSNYIVQVLKDEILCDIVAPEEGRAGLRVDGQVVDPKPVHAAKVPRGTNTSISEDGKFLHSTMDGHLEYKNNAFHVRPVIVIDGDVDYNVGSINFTGDVHIKGDVREGFTVSATGSVTVDGLVEATTVEAGGDMLIGRGVVGDNRALLRSYGTVRVKYLENCVVYASRGIYADCIMNSQIFSDGLIDVTSGRGSIIGGALTAANKIKAKMIGAESGRRTDLTLGILPCVENELQDIKNDILATRKEGENLDRQLENLEAQQGLEGSDPRLAKARMRKSVLQMKEKKLLKRRAELEPMEVDHAHCKLEGEEIFPITTLTLGAAVWTATETKRRCKVRLDSVDGTLKEIIY